MQCGDVYSDVRIPEDRPDVGGITCLAELGVKDLTVLAQAEGFAGRITMEGMRCTWHREINWHGTPEAEDIGDISFRDDGAMIEAGVLADYTELWDGGPSKAMAAATLRMDDKIGFLVTIGTVFVFGIGKTGLPATAELLDRMQAEHSTDLARPLFDGFHAFGHWDGQKGIASLATNPFCEGGIILSQSADGFIWHQTDFDGTTCDLPLSLDP